jgi:hypothetical protein
MKHQLDEVHVILDGRVTPSISHTGLDEPTTDAE